jgi:hypothetical protein
MTSARVPKSVPRSCLFTTKAGKCELVVHSGEREN